jgi:DNA invertase Pin-like site-specific DNA recombinase
MFVKRRKSSQMITPQAGWAVYLRTSDEEAQNPETSQARQRFLIDRAVLERSEMPVIEIYRDVLTGRSPMRSGYQRMLEDARQGHFSHVVVERADRFGRNDTEALRAIDELHEFGVSVRFANHPDLNPMDPDDRVIVALSFTLARRESMLSGLRIKGAGETKRRNGGYLGLHPDGYRSVEDDQPGRKTYMKKGRHLEQDPERAKIWRLAWDLLLEDRLTLAEIAEELHMRGYRYRSGRPFVEVKADGTRKANYNTLAHNFHNWTYAAWIVNVEAGIPPKTLKGNWDPIVTTEEFERGLVILSQRSQHKFAKRKHDYLLRGLIFLEASAQDPTQLGQRLYRMTCSTSNAGRDGGGTAHYRLEKYPIHFLCRDVEAQFSDHIQRTQIDADQIPAIRTHYTQEVAEKLGWVRPDERETLERALKQIDEEEARVLRLYATGVVSEENWRNLWAEWQDKRHRLKGSMALLAQRCEAYIRDLDDALTIIAKLGILYETLPQAEKKELLRHMVSRVVLTPEGKMDRVEWLPPFAYLNEISSKVSGGEQGISQATKTRTPNRVAGRSSKVLECGQYRTRTYNLLDVNETLCQLS